MAISFLTGQRLTADLLNANVIDFFPSTFTKAATTARNTTTTLADDTELAGIALSVGTWEIELRGFFTLTTTNTQGIKTRWAFSGTAADAVRNLTGLGSANTLEADVATTVNMRGRPWLSQDAVYRKLEGSAYGGFREVVSEFVVTVAGNLSLQWAQNASSANNTSLMPGSAFVVRKVR